jgi:hypothetical protein
MTREIFSYRQSQVQAVWSSKLEHEYQGGRSASLQGAPAFVMACACWAFWVSTRLTEGLTEGLIKKDRVPLAANLDAYPAKPKSHSHPDFSV